MRTLKRFWSLVSLVLLVIVLLPRAATTSAPSAPVSARLYLTEHTIDDDFDGAISVYATDIP